MTTLFKTPDNRELPEHPTFDRYRAPCGLVYVSLVTAPGRSQRFILSDLRECPLVGCAEPPPMCVFPMPDQFPREVFLGIANGILELKRREIELQSAVAEAVADGQIPRAA